MERKILKSSRSPAKAKQSQLSWRQELVALGISPESISAIMDRLLAAPLTSLDILVPVPVRGAEDGEMRVFPFRFSDGQRLPKNKRIKGSVMYPSGKTLAVRVLSNHVNQMLKLLRYERKPIDTKSGIYVSIGAVVYHFTALDNDLLAAARMLNLPAQSSRSRHSLLNSKVRARILTMAFSDAFQEKYSALFPFSAKRIADHIQKDSRRPRYLRLAHTFELNHGQRKILEELEGVNEKPKVHQALQNKKAEFSVDEAIELASGQRGALALDWVRNIPDLDLALYEELRDRIEDPFWGHPLSKLFAPPT